MEDAAELLFFNSLLLAEVDAGLRKMSRDPPDGGFNAPVDKPPLAGGVGAGVPDGVANLPFAAVFSDASFPEASMTPPPEEPPLLAARADSNLARASASISLCIVAFALASKSPPAADAVPSPLWNFCWGVVTIV